MDNINSSEREKSNQDEEYHGARSSGQRANKADTDIRDQVSEASDRLENIRTLSTSATQSLRASETTRNQPTASLKCQKSTRNHRLDAEWEPFRDSHELQLNDDEITGAISFMKPTHILFNYLGSTERGRDTDRQSQADSDIQYHWTSRNNRKGRHTLMIRQTSERHVEDHAPWPTTGIAPVFNGIWRMGTCFFIWDISYIIAVVYTLASALLVANAFLSFLPYAHPSFKPPDSIYIVEGILSLIGCTLFLASSFLTFIEAVNQNRRGCFGWKREEVWIKNTAEDEMGDGVERGPVTRIVPDWDNCVHRRNGWTKLFQNDSNEPQNEVNAQNASSDDNNIKEMAAKYVRRHKHVKDREPWMWLPSSHELFSHFIYDVGFVACTILLCSSILFCAAAVAALISLSTADPNNPEIWKWIRIPQLIAGIGFMLSSTLFMVETQTDWWRPQFRVLGWHLSCWNIIGGAGFAACATFALGGSEVWAKFQLGCSFFWGAWAFLIGSVIQWYEALNKHPVERLKEEG
jgi:hypothetical protein